MKTTWDVIVIGGGPGGATAARELARAGRRVLLLEREPFPRFHVGESILPLGTRLLAEMGLPDPLEALPSMPKYGAEFVFGHGSEAEMFRFEFAESLAPVTPRTMNVERAALDRWLLDAAREAGAEVREGAKVTAVRRLAPGDVEIEVGEETVPARWLVDASGQATVLGRHLGTRRPLEDLGNVAYFSHFTGVRRNAGRAEGHPTIVMCREGWFWLIAIDDRRTSVGLVMEPDAARESGVPPDRRLAWGIERCPFVAARMESAVGPETNRVAADFSYRCRPYAGPGWFLVGDAGVFVDPVFATGVSLALLGGRRAAEEILAVDRGGRDPDTAAKRYAQTIERASAPLFRMVRAFYRHGCREMLLTARPPLGLRRATIALLSGEVTPRPPLAVRWRMALFFRLIGLHERFGIVPRRETWSLLRRRAERPDTR